MANGKGVERPLTSMPAAAFRMKRWDDTMQAVPRGYVAGNEPGAAQPVVPAPAAG
jgi:hypothetical protein